jgi:hypothetical protein
VDHRMILQPVELNGVDFGQTNGVGAHLKRPLQI